MATSSLQEQHGHAVGAPPASDQAEGAIELGPAAPRGERDGSTRRLPQIDISEVAREQAGVSDMPLPHIEVLHVPVACVDETIALRQVAQLVERTEPGLVAFANANTLNLAQSDARYAAVLRRTDLLLRDGSGVGIAARMQGRRFPANLNGTDFTPMVLDLAAERGWSVFLLGGRSGVADEAARRMQERHPRLRIAGTHDGSFPVWQEGAAASAVRASGADILLVAMGNPLQELFLARYLSETGVRLGVGVGAFFDFEAGEVSRAPSWMNRAGIEWTYRLRLEPRRLWRRYLVGNPLFLARAVLGRLDRPELPALEAGSARAEVP